MKKIYFMSLLLVFSVLLSGCQMMTIDTKIKEIKDNVKEGYVVDNVEKVYLTDKAFPELLVFTSSNEYTNVDVYHYDQEKKKWHVAYKAKKHPHYSGLETLEVIDVFRNKETKLQHVFVGYYGGTGGVLSFYALGANAKGEITALSNNMLNEYGNSSIEQTDKGFDLRSGKEIVESYYWDDNSYILTD